MDRTSPQSSSDQQCQHCGRWFSIRGIDSHQRNCSLQGYETTLVPLEDTPAPDVDGRDRSPETVADGGQAMEPPTPDVDDQEDDEESCPECGSDEWFDVDGLPNQVLDAQPSLAQHDRACYQCSTDAQGNLTSTVEVYNA